jgi:CD68 antigen
MNQQQTTPNQIKQTTNRNPQPTNHTPQTTHHKPQTTNHKPQTTNHKPQTTNHKPQTTNHKPQKLTTKLKLKHFKSVHNALSTRTLRRWSECARPNAIGLSLVLLAGVKGDTLHLRGVDLIDGTPILDVKPYHPLDLSPTVGDVDVQRLHLPFSLSVYPQCLILSMCNVSTSFHENSGYFCCQFGFAFSHGAYHAQRSVPHNTDVMNHTSPTKRVTHYPRRTTRNVTWRMEYVTGHISELGHPTACG